MDHAQAHDLIRLPFSLSGNSCLDLCICKNVRVRCANCPKHKSAGTKFYALQNIDFRNCKKNVNLLHSKLDCL